MIGSLKSDESWCRQACQGVGCIIVNVDYRMAPDFPHPVPLTDSWSSLKCVFASTDELGIDTVTLECQSVDFQLVVSWLQFVRCWARDEPGMPKLKLQILLVPVVDTRFVPLGESCDPEATPYESYVTNEFAPCLPLNRLRWFYRLWLGTDMGESSCYHNLGLTG